MKDSLGDRMKAHEHVTRALLPRQTYTVIRVDGRSFHTYTRGMERPFDRGLMSAMDATAEALCAEASGSVLAYTQSDEISLLMTDFATEQTQPWFGGVVQKVTSVAASIATAAFNHAMRPYGGRESYAHFDARVFTLPSRDEVFRYLWWRQADAVRNSVSLTARAHLSHRELQGLTSNQQQELLWQNAGVNWNDMPDGFKRGRLTCKIRSLEPITFVHGGTGEAIATKAWRGRWVTEPAPHFRRSDDLEQLVPGRSVPKEAA